MGYLGSKAQAGVWQRIICQMPPHPVYVEPFFGSGQIFWRKKVSAASVVIDRDKTLFQGVASKLARLSTRVIVGDAIYELATLKTTLPPAAVIYCDPPYLLSTRTSRHRYKFEMTESEHAQLLALLREMPCRVLLSGYPSALYSHMLSDWRCISYRTRTRGRTLTELLWANFPEPTELHDYRWIGKNYRERLTLKRFATRFLTRLDAMPELKRNFVLNLVDERHSRR